MTTPGWSVRRLPSLDEEQIDELVEVLIDCVEGGAAVGFMKPLTRERALAFWRRVADGVVAENRVLLVAEDDGGICGTVQLILEVPENQPHRADLTKMLVHGRARRRGLAVALMQQPKPRPSNVAGPCWCSMRSPMALPPGSMSAWDGYGSAISPTTP